MMVDDLNGTIRTLSTAVLSGINVFESCTTSIESNCTIQPPTVPGAHPTPYQTPEVLLNLNQVKITDGTQYLLTVFLILQGSKFTLDM